MSRATPLLLFVAGELACVAPIEAPAAAGESSPGCCDAYPASRNVVDGGLVLVAVGDCTAVPPSSVCRPYETVQPISGWVCDVTQGVGTLTLTDGGTPIELCF
jgi:hypothetical protein